MADLATADKPLTGRDELREWTPELLAAARERIHGSTNVSRAFAEHLLNQLEAALRAADKPLTGREHTHPTRQTPGYERADIPTWPDCPACAATSTAPALDALITARHAFERHPGPADHPRCRQWAEEVLEVVALSVPTAPALDVAVDTILAWAKDYYGTTNMPAGGMFAEAVRVSRLSPTTDTPVSARVTPKPHYASQAEFGAALEDERDEEPERYSYEEGRS